jgi:hypothetical protein
MLFMTIERFKDRDARAVYRHFREHGRMLPDGLTYVGSWVETNFDRCFQLMECDDARLLQQWATRWHGPGRVRVRAGGAGQGDRRSDRASVVAGLAGSGA